MSRDRFEDAEISEDIRISPLYCLNCGKHAHIGPCGRKISPKIPERPRISQNLPGYTVSQSSARLITPKHEQGGSDTS
jgi:hypothetical protein